MGERKGRKRQQRKGWYKPLSGTAELSEPMLQAEAIQRLQALPALPQSITHIASTTVSQSTPTLPSDVSLDIDLDMAVSAAIASLRATLKLLEPNYGVSWQWATQEELLTHTIGLRAGGRTMRYKTESLLAVGCYAPLSGATVEHGGANLYLSRRVLDALMRSGDDATMQITLAEARRLEGHLLLLAASLATARSSNSIGRFIAVQRPSGIGLDDYLGSAGAVACEGCLALQAHREAAALRGQATHQAITAQSHGGRVLVSHEGRGNNRQGDGGKGPKRGA